jgi:hypothetical protein
MRVKLMTFRYSATLGGFDDTPLTDFARDKELIACREHFYVVNEVPHLTCVVVHQDAVVPQAALDAGREIPLRPAQPSAPRFQRRDGAPDPCEDMLEGAESGDFVRSASPPRRALTKMGGLLPAPLSFSGAGTPHGLT